MIKKDIEISPVEPNWNDMLANLRRQGTPERVFYFEHGLTPGVINAICELAGAAADDGSREDGFRRRLQCHRFLGHELFRIHPKGGRFAMPARYEQQGFTDQRRGPVTSWADFESFQWPDPNAADFSELDWLDTHLPENQRAFHALDVFESAKRVMGYEAMCMAIFDDPELVQAVFDKIGALTVAIAETACDHPSYGALYVVDDLGFKTSLLLDPDSIRRLLLPWHKRLADTLHAHGKLFFLHSCGNMYPLLDEFIDNVGIDAKHSFEDNILPVTEVKKQYGDRLTLLGGMDIDLISRADEDTIRAKTREILSACLPGGGYFFGASNWIDDTIPIKNYLCLLDEARRLTQ